MSRSDVSLMFSGLFLVLALSLEALSMELWAADMVKRLDEARIEQCEARR